MAPRAIVSNFFLFLKNSELKTTHTFQDCRVHFFRQPFSKINSCKLQLRWTLGFGYLFIISNVDKNWSRRVTAIMDKSLEIHLHLWVFLSIHTCPTLPPPPPPNPTDKVGRLHPEFFPEFQHCIGGGRENCKKISERMHCFIRLSIDDRKLWILQWRVPRTFVQSLRGL